MIQDFTKTPGRSGGRLLWLTDTYGDHNGVSTVLKSIHIEIKARNLPVDIMVCSSKIEPDEHLIVLKPVSQFTFPLYRQQPMRIPNFLSVQRAFRRGKYDRIMCSTEGPMGLAALWLKNVFSVDTYFYLHTDWLSFAKEVLSLEQTGLNRLQKLMRIYYKRFGNIFVLNTDQQQWLTGKTMGFDPARVFLTSHWVDGIFSDPLNPVKSILPFDSQRPVVLYTGRISKEKGVMELPGIMQMVWSVFPEIQLVIAGTGPAEEELKNLLPEAFYLGWVGQEYLPALFRAADILLLPSRFDTFSCVVLEALSCGLPVVAYNTKGPKDILEDSVSGFLVENDEEMAEKVVRFFLDPCTQTKMKQAAFKRAEAYEAEKIMDRLLQDTGLIIETCQS
ncbi:MAG: glycosyltransferase [Bacteroidales bacterium]|nr:glycosyltransferase [Bacteroidales bacterium]